VLDSTLSPTLDYITQHLISQVGFGNEMIDGRWEISWEMEDPSLYRDERGGATSAIRVLLSSPSLDAPTSQPP